MATKAKIQATRRRTAKRKAPATSKQQGYKTKVFLAKMIALVIAERSMSQTEAARAVTRATGVPTAESQISLVVTGKIDRGFSVERLFGIANGVGIDLEVRASRAIGGDKRGQVGFRPL